MNSNELIDELRTLRLRLAREIIAMQTAKEAYDNQRAEVAAIRRSIEEVLEEIETGITSRPLLDAIKLTPAPDRPASPSNGKPAEVSRAELIAIVRRGIEEVEGPAGTGCNTLVCTRCRAAFAPELTRHGCPDCGNTGVFRPAIGILVELGEPLDGPATDPRPAGIVPAPAGPRFIAPPKGGWTDAALTAAMLELRIPIANLRLCDRCHVAVDEVEVECPGCRHDAFSAVPSTGIAGTQFDPAFPAPKPPRAAGKRKAVKS